jgi:serine/threonine-protein kinase HipA
MQCLYCYKPLDAQERDFHPACSKKLFGQKIPPVLPYAEDELETLAAEIISAQTAVTGVQAKLSLHLHPGDHPDAPSRLTIVGLWGAYILKPPSPHYPQLPEVEDLTMHLASLAGISVVPHSLIRMASGNLAYVTRRVDRTPAGKLHMEDMCQITGRMTEEKYHGSYEQIGKAILKYASHPGLEVVNFCELLLFSFLTGNADMHLKNFSLLYLPESHIALAPAYDLLATALVNPADEEELALTLNGKKRKITRHDFITTFKTLGLDEKQQENIFRKMVRSLPAWMDFVELSFLSPEFVTRYKLLLEDRFSRI